MRRQIGTAVATLIWIAAFLSAADTPTTTGPHWEISGDLTEACTCAVPCTCNFGEGPSPKHYCWSMFGLSIDKGHYGDVNLDGLHLVAAHGKKSAVWYIDNQASPQQATALKTIAGKIMSAHKYQIHYETAHITQEVGEKGNKLQVDGRGGFEADYITGLDGKTPVVVDNNTTWNIAKSIKGKTKEWQYHDSYGNRFNFSATNSNQGKYDWTDQSEHYF
ncbi:MAG TPA: DUF1326 domain-containing protein [Terriglobia bacterium]|nr:DUF1326 domain-containing protein [Terriglobia bacterium]